MEWTRRMAAWHSKRRISKINNSLVQMAENWYSIDRNICHAIGDAMSVFDELEDLMAESVRADDG